MPAFFIQSKDVENDVITVTDPLLSHIAKSLRAKPGDTLRFNDDQGHRYQTTVTQITKQTLQATVQHVDPPPLSTRPPIILAQALLKGEKMGWVIQKATELGVAAIAPLITDRVILQLSGNQGETHQARWKRIALEAAQQSERWTLPAILPIQTFQQFLEAPRHNQAIFMAEREEAASLLTFPSSTEKPGAGVTVIIGPEGGWSAEEVEAAQSHNFTFATLGKEILRAETASLAVVAILQARFNVEQG